MTARLAKQPQRIGRAERQPPEQPPHDDGGNDPVREHIKENLVSPVPPQPINGGTPACQFNVGFRRVPGDTGYVLNGLPQVRADEHQNADRNHDYQRESRRVAEGNKPRFEKFGQERRRRINDGIDNAAHDVTTEFRPVNHEERNQDDKGRCKDGEEIDYAAQPDPVPDIVLNG